VDGFWAGVILVALTFVAFSAVWRVEDIALRRIAYLDLSRVRVVGVGLAALGLLAGWPVPNTMGTTDFAVLVSAVLSVSALLVVGQAFAILAFMFARWFTRQYVDTRRQHKT
jgi:hypothetical protein